MVLSVKSILATLAASVSLAHAASFSYFVEFDSSLFDGSASGGGNAEPPTVTNFFNWMAGANNTLAPITNLPLEFIVDMIVIFNCRRRIRDEN